MSDYYRVYDLMKEVDGLWEKNKGNFEDDEIQRRVQGILFDAADLLGEILDELEEEVRS